MGDTERAKSRDVVFRRIRGRIVAIKRKGSKKTRERKTGAALIAGGLGASALGSFVAGKMTKSGIRNSFRVDLANKQLRLMLNRDMPGKSVFQKAATKTAARNLKIAKLKFKGSRKLFGVSSNVFAAALAGEGISRISGTLTDRELRVDEEVAANIAGAATIGVSKKAFKFGAISNTRKSVMGFLSKAKLRKVF